MHTKLNFSGQPILGTGFSDGKLWNDQRKFLMKTLSNLGMGKKDTMQDIVEQEADEFAGTLKRRRGQPVQSRVRTSKKISFFLEC